MGDRTNNAMSAIFTPRLFGKNETIAMHSPPRIGPTIMAQRGIPQFSDEPTKAPRQRAATATMAPK